MATRQSLPEIQTNLFIDGQWVEGAMDKKAVINPATGEELVRVSQGGKEETNRAIEAAKKAFPIWSGMELKERVAILHKVADLIEENADRLALIMTLEQGKP